jgi:hypothetical protein
MKEVISIVAQVIHFSCASLHKLILVHRDCGRTIYKRPLEEEFTRRPELLRQIRKTVIHELAHHFGYTDRDLERWTTVY